MAEISNFFSGDLANALDQAMEWMLARLNANVSPFAGNAVFTPTDPALVEGAVTTTNAQYSNFAQEPWPNIVLDPIFGLPPDEQA